ncbi:Putative membrane protein [Clostridium neonatale]|nr:Putative membrane protein [Clostridium neonatale]
MNMDFTRLIYIIVTTCIIFLVGVLFIRLLPWLILAGVILYIIFKIKSFIRYKK